MVKDEKASWKSKYFQKIIGLFEEYQSCLIVSTYKSNELRDPTGPM